MYIHIFTIEGFQPIIWFLAYYIQTNEWVCALCLWHRYSMLWVCVCVWCAAECASHIPHIKFNSIELYRRRAQQRSWTLHCCFSVDMCVCVNLVLEQHLQASSRQEQEWFSPSIAQSITSLLALAALLPIKCTHSICDYCMPQHPISGGSN